MLFISGHGGLPSGAARGSKGDVGLSKIVYSLLTHVSYYMFSHGRQVWRARLDKHGIFDRDIFLIIVKGLSPFPPFYDYQNISQLNVRHAFQASYPKLDSRERFIIDL